ncbi:hypothetical protein [Halioxenophilus sp. WMMB6]|uniref:hypothetical protein n=1 Tax=Halioxenophilus sp. WMMB6 TaxID=3073815 RepID=UPI00295F267C|nr:hypothetical protein [Halioxenophilus sp. WMMB6]
MTIKPTTPFIAATIALLLCGCTLFTSHYDATRLENFTHLKAIHLKLFHDWTADSTKAWNAAEIQQYCESGDLAFWQAFEFAKSKERSDQTGQKAITILWDEFTANCGLLIKRQKLFSTVFRDELLPQIEQNYDYAIQGELTRVNAPQ